MLLPLETYYLKRKSFLSQKKIIQAQNITTGKTHSHLIHTNKYTHDTRNTLRNRLVMTGENGSFTYTGHIMYISCLTQSTQILFVTVIYKIVF